MPGRYPLGLRFPPNRKERDAGLPGGEYHYKNVSPELHAELLAAKTNPDYDNSIGVFLDGYEQEQTGPVSVRKSGCGNSCSQLHFHPQRESCRVCCGQTGE